MIQDRVGLSGEKAGSDSAKIREVIFPCFILFYFFNLKLIFLIRILMCGLFYMFDVRIFQGKLKYSILNQWTLKKENNRQYFIYFATCNPFTPALREFFLKLWIIYTKKKIQKSIFLSIFCQPADISIVATVKSVFRCHFCWIFESNNLLCYRNSFRFLGEKHLFALLFWVRWENW